MFRLHHIDIWATNIEESINFYQTLGFNKVKEINNIEKNKKIILMELDNILLEIKHHYVNNCEHNKVQCGDNKVFGLSVDNINEAKTFIETENLTKEDIIIQKGILGQQYFFIHDPNGMLIEIIEEKN